MPSEAENRFHGDMRRGAERLKREIGYNPTRFQQMLGELGGVGAAKQLLRGGNASDGFTTLWEAGRLELSVEAFVLLPWYRDLFEDHHIDTARYRLSAHGFDVDRFLREAQRNPPVWASDNV
ncbi:hypothetical protein [Streptomyces sp. PSKA30]|uniref:hypothetical protein n=1 Tax=Streptomyces sp. PSKA30 TaxID=2874597 RepID=UPI001CD09660|nr:hypothetical protein [Streptomyces sp. PSKA30]MBZ9642945.1 hypothetical protein [Streptomyces sp. PSKA30]